MKEVMEGYVGVKFTPHCLSSTLPPSLPTSYKRFRLIGDVLRDNGLTYRNAGNMSMRCREGFLVTAARTNLGQIEENEIVCVTDCSLQRNSVDYCGPKEPSSEALLHHLILRNRLEAGAVIHAHDERATSDAAIIALIAETPREEPYGTVALAQVALKTFRENRKIIILKNHGFVAIGRDLADAAAVILETHEKLMALHEDRTEGSSASTPS